MIPSETERPKAYLIPYPVESFAKPILIGKEQACIGRGAVDDLHVRVDDQHLSRRHACIRFEDGRFFIEDLDSQNGTFLNKERVKKAPLASHDKITVGSQTYLFLLQPDAVCDLLSPPSAGAAETIDISLGEIDFSGIWAQNADRAAHGFLNPKEDSPSLTSQAAEIAHKRLSLLYQLSENLRATGNVRDVYEKGVALIMQAFPAADYALVAKRSSSADSFDILCFQFGDQRQAQDDAIPISQTVFDWVLKEKVTLVSENLLEDHRFQESESISVNDLRSIVCAPISGKQRAVGLLYAQANNLLNPFNKEDAKFVSAVANEIALNIENIRFQKEMLHNERMAAVGMTVSHLAHNLKNMLAVNQTAVGLMDSHIKEHDYTRIEQKWAWITNSLADISKLSTDMLEYVQDDDLQASPVDVNALIRANRSLFESSLSSEGVKLELELTGQDTLWPIDEMRFKQALLNLVLNAADALKQRRDGRIRIGTSVSKERHLAVCVTDNGCGIPDSNKNKILDLFFTTKGSRGTGLGLAMVQKFVQKSGGRLKFDSEEGQGSVFSMIFPHHQSTRPSAAPQRLP